MYEFYDFSTNHIPGDPEDAPSYWRDVGTVDSYFQANMELRSPLPTLNMYNRSWRIRTAQRDYPPSRFVKHNEFSNVDVIDSLVCEGSIISCRRLVESLIGYDCFYMQVQKSRKASFYPAVILAQNQDSACSFGQKLHYRPRGRHG